MEKISTETSSKPQSEEETQYILLRIYCPKARQDTEPCETKFVYNEESDNYLHTV